MLEKNATFHIKEVMDGSDDFLLEVKRMRNSLNALAMKNIMFEGKGDEEVKNIEILPPPLPVSAPPTPIVTNEAPTFIPLSKKSIKIEVAPIPIKEPPTFIKLSEKPILIEPSTPLVTSEPPLPIIEPYIRPISSRQSRQDSNRTYSGKIEQEDVLKALILEGAKQASAVISPQNTAERPKPRVHFIDESEKLLKNPSRESDEVATINELPWQKKHEFRMVTPYFKAKTKNQIMALGSNEEPPKTVTENISLGFRPIERNRSKEDSSIVRPVPLFTSKSYQELPRNDDFRTFDMLTKTKSNDDLLLDNIDGARKFTESKTHKLLRMRSTSNNTLNRVSGDQSIYENFQFQSQTSIDENFVRKTRKPMPQPRTSFQDDKRTSKTITYVLDKSKDEFVLQDPELIEEEYESILIQNEVDQYRDSAYFSALLNSREDCESFDFFHQALSLSATKRCNCSHLFCHRIKLSNFIHAFFYLSLKLFLACLN